MGDGKDWRKQVSTLLNRMFVLQYGGSSSTKFRWMQGYTDGYMQALIEMGFMTDHEMLELIQTERATFLESNENTAETNKQAA